MSFTISCLPFLFVRNHIDWYFTDVDRSSSCFEGGKNMKRMCPICQKEYETDKRTEIIIKDFPEKKKFWIEMQCPNSTSHFKILREREIAKILKEVKQKILDLFHGGKTIGDISKELNLDSMIVAEIIDQNIQTISILRRESIS